MRPSGRRILVWLALAGVLVFLYAPLLPPLILAIEDPVTGQATLQNFTSIHSDPTLMGAVSNSVIIAAMVGVAAPLLGLAAAQAVRSFGTPRLIVTVILLPLFIPGVSMGVSTSLFFNLMGIDPSLMTMAAVQTLWALPFAFLIIMTVMSGFDMLYLEAAYTCGANRAQAFLEVELPQIAPGISGAVTFSIILSFNETIRTAVVQGGNNTIQTFIWSRYQQVGLTPNMYALMSIIIAVTLLLILVLAALGRRRPSPI
ncbi:putative spermidine/putrescine transport system permease protein/spermidine/putrescine transport system permease protein [Rhizobiales bacterium GAS191]|nr:putative spermidine/putrescine transport system permease protein/spermidine/putrescine transport system permease protein [Rhizobiales bacterium GAS191]